MDGTTQIEYKTMMMNVQYRTKIQYIGWCDGRRAYQRPHDGGFVSEGERNWLLKQDYRKPKNTTRSVGFPILHS